MKVPHVVQIPFPPNGSGSEKKDIIASVSVMVVELFDSNVTKA